MYHSSVLHVYLTLKWLNQWNFFSFYYIYQISIHYLLLLVHFDEFLCRIGIVCQLLSIHQNSSWIFKKMWLKDMGKMSIDMTVELLLFSFLLLFALNWKRKYAYSWVRTQFPTLIEHIMHESTTPHNINFSMNRLNSFFAT